MDDETHQSRHHGVPLVVFGSPLFRFPSGTRLSVHQLFWIFRGSSLFDEYAPVVFRHIQLLLSEYLSRNVLLSVVSHPHQAVVGLQLSEHSAKIHSGIGHLLLRPAHHSLRHSLCCKYGLFPFH